MRKLFVVAVAFAVALLVGGPALMSVAAAPGEATTTAGTSVSNNAVFVALVSDFGPVDPITKGDVEAGCKSLGSATFNVDATATWFADQFVSASTVPLGAVSSTAFNEDPFQLGTAPLCPGEGEDGFLGLIAGSGDVTSGTLGEDVTIHAGLFFSSPGGAGAHFDEAPDGTYEFTMLFTVSD